MKARYFFVVMVMLSMMATSVKAQIVIRGREIHSEKVEKARAEHGQDVKIDVLHGSSNWYVGAGFGFNVTTSDPMVEVKAGRRFGDKFRLEIDGMVNPSDEHLGSWVGLVPTFDLVSSESAFYQKTRLDISLGAIIGTAAQTQGKRKFLDKQQSISMADIQTELGMDVGARLGLSWRASQHWQIRLEASYHYLPMNNKTAKKWDEITKNINMDDLNNISKPKSGMLIVGGSVTFHF